MPLEDFIQVIEKKISNQARALSILGLDNAERIVDLVAYENIGNNIQLSKNERRELAHVLHNACVVDGVKVNILSSIDLMCESLKRIILNESEERLQLPTILPIKSMEGITE